MFLIGKTAFFDKNSLLIVLLPQILEKWPLLNQSGGLRLKWGVNVF